MLDSDLWGRQRSGETCDICAYVTEWECLVYDEIAIAIVLVFFGCRIEGYRVV